MTSDRDIAAHAWASDAVPISSDDFMNAIEKSQMEKRVLYEQENYEQEDEEYTEPDRKGSPKQLSKKERAIKKTLSKLS